jgi:hypothetical protein
MFDEAGAIGIIAEELDSHAKSHVQVARAAMSGTPAGSSGRRNMHRSKAAALFNKHRTRHSMPMIVKLTQAQLRHSCSSRHQPELRHP